MMFWEVLFWKNARDAELLRDDYRWKARWSGLTWPSA
jgi:hypothetical protein